MNRRCFTLLLIALALLLAAPAAQAKHRPRAAKVMSGFVGGRWICPVLPNGRIVVSADACATSLPSWL